jgi:hypothetical protein
VTLPLLESPRRRMTYWERIRDRPTSASAPTGVRTKPHHLRSRPFSMLIGAWNFRNLTPSLHIIPGQWARRGSNILPSPPPDDLRITTFSLVACGFRLAFAKQGKW